MAIKWLSVPPPVLRRGVGGFGGGGGGRGGGGTYGLIVNRLALHPWRQIDLLRRNWEEKRLRRLEEEDGSHDVPPNN